MLRSVVWDYEMNEEQLIDAYLNDNTSYPLTKDKLKVKLLNRFTWHELIKAMGDGAFELLEDDIIKQIYPVSYRNELFDAKRILYG